MRLAGVFAVLILAGCSSKVSDWGNELFHQTALQPGHQARIALYMRSSHVYDIFDTVAFFDVLWVSDEVRTVYSEIHNGTQGKTDEASQLFLRRQLVANEHFVSFYVITGYDLALDAKPPVWNMYMRVDGQNYQPFEVKVAELSPEYKLFFKKQWSAHKAAYEVKFERKKADGTDILSDQINDFELFFSSPHYYTSVKFVTHPLLAPDAHFKRGRFAKQTIDVKDQGDLNAP